MRSFFLTRSLSALLALPALASAFEPPFEIVGPDSPPGRYTLESGVTTLGAWSAGFNPAPGGTSFIDTTAAPASVTLGSSVASSGEFAESFTTLSILVPAAAELRLSVSVLNQGAGDYAAGLEIYLDELPLYSLTAAPAPGNPTPTFDLCLFRVEEDQLLEFRSVSRAGAGSSAASTATISFGPSAAPIPEPSAFAALAGLIVLGQAGLRRRPR